MASISPMIPAPARRNLVLATKLAVPRPRGGLVARPHLLDRLDAGMAGRLTLVVAPPGFGKTTLLASWLHHLGLRILDFRPGAASSHPASRIPHPSAGWVSLDEGDNDPTRFWGYVISAVDRFVPGVGDHALAMLRSPQPPPVEVALGALLNELDSVEIGEGSLAIQGAQAPAWVLVLDDYHTIVSQAIHEAVALFIERMPPALHLVIASRRDPPLPLPRLRARGELAELRSADLRFSIEEAAALLNREMKLGLPAQDVAALAARTEGWVAALHLAALALRTASSAPASGPADEPRTMAGPAAASIVHHLASPDRVASFAGSHRYLVDYLADEVLRRQPQPVQTFLLRTSILDQLCASLCDAVASAEAQEPGAGEDTGSRSPAPGSQEMLEELERAGLFLQPLDGERRWYRYHNLFAEFLRERLRRAYPALAPELHRRAAGWYGRAAEAGEPAFVAAAVGHWLAGEDPAQAARLVERVARPMLLRSETATLLGWLQALPAGIVHERPELCIVWAWALAISGQFDAVEPHLRAAEAGIARAERRIEQGEPAQELLGSHYSTLNLRSELVAARAALASLRREIPETIALARQALAMLPSDSVIVRSVVALMLGNASYLSGDMAAAMAAFQESIAASRRAESLIILLFAMRQLGELQIREGRLHQAAATFRAALAEAARAYPHYVGRPDRPIPVAGTAYVGLGMVLYEWNDLDGAARNLASGIALGQEGQNVEILLMGPITMSRVLHARGDAAGARETIGRALEIARDTGVARLIDWMRAEQAHLWLLQGDVAAAAAWADGGDTAGRPYRTDDEPDYLREIDYLALAQTRIAQGRAPEVIRLIERLLAIAEAQGRHGSVVQIRAVLAVALHAAGRPATALAELGRALERAAPEGYVRTFVDLGPPLRPLLAECRAQLARRAAHDLAARGLLDYCNRLLAAFPDLGLPIVDFGLSKQPEIANPKSQIPNLVEPLSERELEVLRLIAAGLANQEIADRLVVGLSTVKKHINNIYAKLEVRSRTQAMVRARQLGLVP